MRKSGTTGKRPGRRGTRAAGAVLLVAALALTGCSAGASDSGDTSQAAGGEAAAADRGAAKGAGGGQSDAKSSRREPPKLTGVHIIRTATLTVQVKDVPQALDKARTAAEDAGGIVGNESTDRDGRGHERSRVVLRVPQERYEQVLADLAGAGRLVERNVKAQDVTDQVVDVESRVTSQRASVARVRELMDKATKLSDVVALEGELSTRESDLEALLAQQASLKDRTSLATITLSLTETPVKPAGHKDEDPGFTDAVAGGWGAFVTMLRWLAVAVGAVLPFAVVGGLLVFVWLRLVRPRLPRGATAAAQPPTSALGPLPAHPPAGERGEEE
ncbi:DUF4349 domain-containing protein [Streptomyces sp. NBC_00063]|uniref:DUF4349 domain-containing protein n=1 Tax=Streptomyces sp. NBC_00063 TaxID=2975638 RepID=UPI002257B699|nr:DUF4349 domain-containing protein [Streptomyces sp. NBC_00063]MCX5440312.1 DUF4349 domain-containing protein [Streptomyces sp. NBC_00063]